jgi:hypothetical protein
VGARVGRSIALSSSQTHDHNITRDSPNQGDAALGGQQVASLKSVVSFCLLDGTAVELREPNFSSHSAQIGDPILCHAGALAAFGLSVFPGGAYLAGHFQEYRDPGRLFGKGWIELAFDRLVLEMNTPEPEGRADALSLIYWFGALSGENTR